MKLVPLLLVLVTAAATAAPARPDTPIDAAERARVIDAAVAALHASYVFPDVAKQLETALRTHAKAGKYDALTSSRAFAKALTADLQAVSHDKHMHVYYSAAPLPADLRPDVAPAETERAELHRAATATNAMFAKVERLDGNIGYLRVDGFFPADELGPRAAAAMSLLADTDALILDLRANQGGEPDSVALLVSYLYPAGTTLHLNDIYSRPDGTTHQYWTSPSLPGRRYPDRPVYVLTSHTTISAAEECAYDLQVLKRATLVGEVTAGGANPGGPARLGAHLGLFVPTGRAINPVTHTNWEGTGVKPDLAAPAAAALDVAYLAALRKVRANAGANLAPELRDEIDHAIETLSSPRK